MNTNYLTPRKFLLPFFLLFFGLYLTGFAQNDPADICEEGDCPQSVFSIALDAPLKANPASPQRTEQFKQAYLAVERIKLGNAQNPEWQYKYKYAELGGKSCLRMYQLESHFAYEYEQNPAFQKFINQQENDISTFKENGFESSRKAMNLNTRMKKHCSSELKKLEKKKGPSQKSMPDVYTKLGIVQGYFDKEGNQLKTMRQLAPPPQSQTAKTGKPKKLSKKKQVAQLKQNLAQLPLGAPTQTQLTDLASGLGAAKPKLGLFGKLFKGLKNKLSGLLPKPKKLLSKLGRLKDAQNALKGFKPKVPNPGLLSKVNDLLKDRKNLSQQAGDLADKTKALQGLFNQLNDQKNNVEQALNTQTSEVEQLKNTLQNLLGQKDNLATRLENKPKKHLEELKQLWGNLDQGTNQLLKAIDQGSKLKDDLLSKVGDLTNAKDKAADQLQKLEDLANLLGNGTDALDQKTNDVSKLVDQIKAEEALQAAKEKAITAMKQKLKDLAPELPWLDEIKICEGDLKQLANKINPLKKVQNTFKKKLGGLLSSPAKLLGKLEKLSALQDKLKSGKQGIPILGSSLSKLDQLLTKGNALSNTVQAITGKQLPLQEKIDGLGQRLENVQKAYDEKVDQIGGLKQKVTDLVEEKTKLRERLTHPIEQVEQVQIKVEDFVSRYNIFGQSSKCVDVKDLQDKIEKLKGDQETTEPEVKALEEDLDESTKAEEQLEQETKDVEQEIDEHTEREIELKEEQAEIEKNFGKKIELETVPVEAWTESFEVKRPYWDAVFHPDDEVVKGFKGRYFEVRLKDAKKNVKLLFGPGEYFMDKTDFRDNYGSTIGAFVTEALLAMKKTDRNKIQLFVQGSADIVGQKTFKGKLDKQYFYEEVTVLPQDEEGAGFLSDPASMKIPIKNFRNTDLPNLRGNFLREMIGIYSKKLQPILLEGQVKEVANRADRNAVIYLFIPETLVAEYEGP